MILLVAAQTFGFSVWLYEEIELIDEFDVCECISLLLNETLLNRLVSAQNFGISMCLHKEIELIEAFDVCQCILLLLNGN